MPAGLEIDVMKFNWGSGFPIARFEHGFSSIIMENGIPIMESMTTNEIGEISVIYPMNLVY